ncbi:SxtJ family membrane protein [Halochromatium glycolicum]|uniref:SxtJ n=1 Tax=Halochromatium glycolicum TaxID=85075 RepID=A0AAJ0U104_9GAMM|nr:SxtJ family membrane protein [Halochromatium glycolicum]MBK1703253.1 hypothetical protein [Halochromatium glycolicum]
MHPIPDLDRAGLRRFALSTAVLLVLLFALLLPWLFDTAWPRWPWAVAAVLALWGLLAPRTLRPLYRGWMRFGLVMSRITTPLILGLVYCALFVPAGWIMRLSGHDPMQRRLDPDAETYRTQSQIQPPSSMERPY